MVIAPADCTSASFRALRNVFCFLSGEAHPVSAVDRDVWFKMVQRFDPRDTSERKMSAARFTRFGNPVDLRTG